jgi:4-cresol dehydrogenase (hydroxylating)
MAVVPTLSEESLESAIDEMTAALGSARVLTAPDALREFRDPMQFETWDENVASAVVMPETVEEVQEVVRIAGSHGVPLWTHSQGRNNGYGGPAPRVRGSIVVSLRNMNSVLEINEELGYAVVEPGVRWFDLYEAIVAGGHRLMLSIADVGWGSVMGNTLDHGITYMPYGLDMGMQCGMEVVLADGSLMRTGMGAMEGNRAWHVYKRGLGPTVDQLFMQSNFGIVTKMGVWLMPYPEVYMPLWLRVWRDDDVGKVVDILRTLMLDGTIRMVPQLMNTLLLGAVLSRRDQWYTGEGPMPESAIDRMARELEVGRWIMRFALYGDEAICDHRFAKIKRAFETIEGA